jgi:hypothetical protein
MASKKDYDEMLADERRPTPQKLSQLRSELRDSPNSLLHHSYLYGGMKGLLLEEIFKQLMLGRSPSIPAEMMSDVKGMLGARISLEDWSRSRPAGDPFASTWEFENNPKAVSIIFDALAENRLQEKLKGE